MHNASCLLLGENNLVCLLVIISTSLVMLYSVFRLQHCTDRVFVSYYLSNYSAVDVCVRHQSIEWHQIMMIRCEMWGGQSDLICRIEREMGLMFNEDWRPPIEESDWNNRLQFSWDLNILLWLVAGAARGPWNYSKLRFGWFCPVVTRSQRKQTQIRLYLAHTNNDAERSLFL